MNRRSFLLDCISTPIAGKVDAVSAAPRPEWIESVRHVATIESNEIITWKLYINHNSAICDSGELKNIIWSPLAPLDSRCQPCDASIAGRDQIG